MSPPVVTKPKEGKMHSTKGEMKAALPELTEKLVPETRSKMMLTSSLRNDSIPDHLLTGLISTVCPLEKSPEGPIITNTDFKVHGMSKTDAVWQHPLVRRKYKHLLDQPTSVTGAGRDISFLCDAVVSERAGMSQTEMGRRGSPQDVHKDLSLEESLIPSEYHIVKNKGVIGLQCYEDKYTVLLEDEKRRLRVFPSMKPNSRWEVLQLKQVMDEMLEKAGVNQEPTELKSPSQMEGLLQLVRVEQDIYNTIFHELIRQVSVDCAERGQLLAKLREKYVALLERIPQQVKGLHTEALAQRALVRHSAEEITCLKKFIAQLNNDLDELKEHNEHLSRQAKWVEQDLAMTQEELQKTSGLVAENRELYEMQRHRLEGQVSRLTEEKDLWSKVTYGLALKVINANKLQQARRLDESSQTWAKTAKHFCKILTTKDAEDMECVVKLTDQWKDEMTAFIRRLNDTEQSQCEELKKVKAGIGQWQVFCETNVNNPDVKLEESQDKLFFDVNQWSLWLTVQCERYGGADFLSCQETLNLLSQLQDSWVDVALQLFRRHPGPSGDPPKGQETMRELGRAVSEIHKQLEIRITGESVAKLLSSLIGPMERWALKLKAMKDKSKALLHSDWLNLEIDLGKWTEVTEEGLLLLSSIWTESESVKSSHFRTEVNSVSAMLREFVSMQDVFFDCENQRLSDEVCFIHSAMTRWVVNLLLLMAPGDDQDPPLHSDPVQQALLTVSFQDLEEDRQHLIQKLDHYSKHLVSSCLPIVEKCLRKPLVEDESVNVLAELNSLQRESGIWRQASQRLLLDFNDGQGTVDPESNMNILPSVKSSEDFMVLNGKSVYKDKETKSPSVEEEEVEKDSVGEGVEESSEPIHKFIEESYSKRSLDQDCSTTESTLEPERTDEEVAQPQTPSTQSVVDAQTAVEELQLQLSGAESRVHNAEEHAQRTEKVLQAALGKIEELEQQLKARVSVEPREKRKAKRVTAQRAVTAEPRIARQKTDSSLKLQSAPKKPHNSSKYS